MWFRILMVTLGSFALGTDAFVIAGILPEIAHSLSVSSAVAGQLETAFSLTVAIGSPVLVTLLGNMTPRHQLLLSLVIFIAGNILAAAAVNFDMLFAARIIAACGAAIYIPTAPYTVAVFAPDEKRGRALAFVGTGLTSSLILGVPLGILIGSQMGWRYTFIFAALLALIALIGILAFFPEVARPPAMRLGERLAYLRRPSLLLILCDTALWMIGGYTLYSYLGLVLLNVTHLTNVLIGLIFFWFGAISILGNILGGYGSDHWGPVRTLAIGLVGGALGLVLISLFSASPIGIAIALAIWAVAGWMLGPPQQYRLLSEAPEAAGILFSLNGSAVYLGIGLGAAFGGLMLHYTVLSSLGWIGSIWELLALVVLAASIQVVKKKNKVSPPLETVAESSVV